MPRANQIDRSDAARVERFCQEYVVDHNGRQAAIRAGYSPRSAHVQASRMLSRANVNARLAELEEKLLERSTLTAELVRESCRRLLAFRLGMLYREDGSLFPPNELPEDVQDCIQSVAFDERGRVAKYRFYDKDACRNTAARITGLLKDPKLIDFDPIKELMERISHNDSGLPANPTVNGESRRDLRGGGPNAGRF